MFRTGVKCSMSFKILMSSEAALTDLTLEWLEGWSSFG